MTKMLLRAAFVPIAIGIAALANASFLAAQTLTLHFETNKSELLDDHRTDLEKFLATLAPARPEQFAVTVVGHTDSRGTDEFNQDLSFRRGQSVADFLTAQGFVREKITLQAKGETLPSAPNADPTGMAENRRVEVVFERQMSGPAWVERNTVPQAKAKFLAEKGFKFESARSGTRVNIAPGSLVLADGSPVRGPVEFAYREYNGLADFLAAGIPMHYDDQRGENFFNSAGMFEVRVSQGDKEVFVAPDKAFDVSFAQTKAMPETNFYYLNESNGGGNWEFLPNVSAKDGKGQAQRLPSVLSENDAVASNLSSGSGEQMACPVPNLRLAYRTEDEGRDFLPEFMAAMQTGRDLAFGKIHMPLWFKKAPNETTKTYLSFLEKGEIRIKKDEDKGILFFPEDLSGIYTELKPFQKYYFATTTEGSANDSSMNFVFFQNPNLLSTSIELEAYAPGSPTGKPLGPVNFFRMTVSTPSDGQTIKVALYEKDKGKLSPEEADAAYQQYLAIRAERRAGIDATVERWRSFSTYANVHKTAPEFCLTGRAWNEWFEKNLPAMRSRYDELFKNGTATDTALARVALELYQKKSKDWLDYRAKMAVRTARRTNDLSNALALKQFGVYNCDQIFRLSNEPMMLSVNFQKPDGTDIRPLNLSMVERATKLFFSFDPGRGMYYFKGRQIDVVVSGLDGKTYLLPAAEYAKLNVPKGNTTPVKLALQEVSEQVKSPAAWSALLGI